MGLNDGEVVRRVLDGDTELYGILVERYRTRLGRYAVSLLRDADAANDAMQNAFIRAYNALGSLRDPEGFGGWFYRILTNECRNALARQRPTADLDQVDLEAADRADAQVERRELGDAIAAALDELTSEQREAFVLKHVEGLSYDQMASLLQTGSDALKMRVYRARDRLRQILGEHP